MEECKKRKGLKHKRSAFKKKTAPITQPTRTEKRQSAEIGIFTLHQSDTPSLLDLHFLQCFYSSSLSVVPWNTEKYVF